MDRSGVRWCRVHLRTPRRCRRCSAGRLATAAHAGQHGEAQRRLYSSRKASGYWQNKNNLLDAMRRAEQHLGIEKPEDWYSVTLADLREVDFASRITKPYLAELLGEMYPGHNWEAVYLNKGRFAEQKRLEKAVAALFPNENVTVNARKEAQLVNPETRDYLELDIFIPSLSLAFEYQDRHHYATADYVYKPLDAVQQRDAMKKSLASAKGITLIAVPCWWDGTEESLISTIKSARPDLLVGLGGSSAIPAEPPPNFFDKKIPTIEGIGQPTNACFFSASTIDPTDWWMFEKYDGMRGFWNPTKRAFYSRLGNLLPLPRYITESMPEETFLDGEIWFGPDNFTEVLKLSGRASEANIDWEKFRYMVYDIPTLKGPYRERYSLLETLVRKNEQWKHVTLAPKEQCRGERHLEAFFQDVLDRGGEGVILRDPFEPYHPGRAPGYLKHKKFRDAEARIVRSHGIHRWVCELPNGVQFTATAGSTEFAKRWGPTPGDVVSFKHHGFLMATKKPKLPTIYRVRSDLKWEDAVRSWKEQKPIPSARPIRKPPSPGKPKGHWNDVANRKQFFIEYAEQAGFDPRDSARWEDVTCAQIHLAKGLGPLALYNGSLQAALEDTFPEWNFRFTRRRKPGHYWQDEGNRRAFFDSYAQEKGFHPLNPDSWYSVSLVELKKKGKYNADLFKGGVCRAIRNAYPEVCFSKWEAQVATT